MTKEERQTQAAQSNDQHRTSGSGEVQANLDVEEDPPIILIFDGHGSHTTLEWVDFA
jgi:hypothetical protein